MPSSTTGSAPSAAARHLLETHPDGDPWVVQQLREAAAREPPRRRPRRRPPLPRPRPARTPALRRPRRRPVRTGLRLPAHRTRDHRQPPAGRPRRTHRRPGPAPGHRLPPLPGPRPQRPPRRGLRHPRPRDPVHRATPAPGCACSPSSSCGTPSAPTNPTRRPAPAAWPGSPTGSPAATSPSGTSSACAPGTPRLRGEPADVALHHAERALAGGLQLGRRGPRLRGPRPGRPHLHVRGPARAVPRNCSPPGSPTSNARAGAAPTSPSATPSSAYVRYRRGRLAEAEDFVRAGPPARRARRSRARPCTGTPSAPSSRSCSPAAGSTRPRGPRGPRLRRALPGRRHLPRLPDRARRTAARPRPDQGRGRRTRRRRAPPRPARHAQPVLVPLAASPRPRREPRRPGAGGDHGARSREPGPAVRRPLGDRTGTACRGRGLLRARPASSSCEESVSHLERSPAAYELACALVALGTELRRTGPPEGSRRAPLPGLDAAVQCGADGLVEDRPRRAGRRRAAAAPLHSTETDTLTARERAAAALTVRGRTRAGRRGTAHRRAGRRTTAVGGVPEGGPDRAGCVLGEAGAAAAGSEARCRGASAGPRVPAYGVGPRAWACSRWPTGLGSQASAYGVGPAAVRPRVRDAGPAQPRTPVGRRPVARRWPGQTSVRKHVAPETARPLPAHGRRRVG